MLSILKGIFGATDKELVEVLKQNPMLIDVRTSAEYAGGTVKGAINIPLSDIQQAEKLDKSKLIVLFCQSGNRSGQAVQYLKNQGFTNVHNGGGWQSLKATVEG